METNVPGVADDPLVTCEVTGQQVPLSETVEFQGRRVSAAGKAEMMRRLDAGEGLEDGDELAGRWYRLGAAILDGIILGVPFFLIGAGIGAYAAINAPDLLLPLTFVASGLGLVVTFLYSWLLHSRYGQTVGKMAAKIQAVGMDGQIASKGTYGTRALIVQSPNLIQLIPGALGLTVGLTDPVLEGVVGIIVGVLSLAIFLPILFRSDKRGLHDLAAGTQVIRKGD